MEVKVLSAEQSAPDALADAVLDLLPQTWNLNPTACILSSLLGRPITPDAVRDKAAGLGLLHYPAQGLESDLTAKTLSRLFLAGYRIPAYATTATMAAARLHLEEDGKVFVCLRSLSTFATSDAGVLSVFEAIRGDGEAFAHVSVVLRPIMLSGQIPDALVDQLAPEQSAFGVPMVVVARGWEVLSGSGGAFFGGSRDPDGTYHWDVAECATDSQGSIVRYY
jgi:hypothetical protein